MNFLFHFCQFEFLFQIVLILQVKHIMLGGVLINSFLFPSHFFLVSLTFFFYLNAQKYNIAKLI